MNRTFQRMMMVAGLITFATGILFVAGASLQEPMPAEAETTEHDSTEGADTYSLADKDRIRQRLRDILTQQESLLQQLDAMMEELRIVKVRVSR